MPGAAAGEGRLSRLQSLLKITSSHSAPFHHGQAFHERFSGEEGYSTS